MGIRLGMNVHQIPSSISATCGTLFVCFYLAALSMGALDIERGLAQGLAPDAQSSMEKTSPSLVIKRLTTSGNKKVESEAILNQVGSKVGATLDPFQIREDIKAIYALGFFDTISALRKDVDGGIEVTFEVQEKGAIASIAFEGLEEFDDEDLRDKLTTKLYTILNESDLDTDARMIEQEYLSKGYYLVRVESRVDTLDSGELRVTFVVEEQKKIQVSEVFILGNKALSDGQILPFLATKSYTRSTALGGSAIFQRDFINRDVEFMAFLYKDRGYAKVQVGKPVVKMDADRAFVRVTFSVEEGKKYNVGSIRFKGDLILSETELLEKLKLKPGELFKHSFFVRDIEGLVELYGDEGYAYADPSPQTSFDDDKQTVDIVFDISKGEKVYFGEITITGNEKTRDNVIRREFDISDSALYSGSGLSKTKANIARLGFFEDVQVLRERAGGATDLLNIEVKVQEKPTGQLQAAFGFTPTSAAGNSGVFGQGRYDEKNQSGKGWATNFTFRWAADSQSVEAGFSDPKVNDSPWSLGLRGFYKTEDRRIASDIFVVDKRIGGSVTVGRRIIEFLRGSLTYRIQRITQESDDLSATASATQRRYLREGLSSSLIARLRYNDTNDFIEPSEGFDASIIQELTGGPLGGDFDYLETSLEASFYYPIDFSDTFRTHFRLHGLLANIYPLGEGSNNRVPYTERYRMGGIFDLRGYDNFSIGPKSSIMTAPFDSDDVNDGGDKKLLFQLEYFVPLIPEAGIKAVLFADTGRPFNDDQQLSFDDFKSDVGFGFRWKTPIAPFRFEFAYPVEEDGDLGDMNVIFFIGY